MERIYVECIPDKILVKKLGFYRKDIYEAGDKSRVYAGLKKGTNLIAIVDEDPNPDPSAPKYYYERELIFIEKKYGLSLYKDNKRNNKVIILQGKLEDWILDVCKKDNIKHSLPENGNQLHKEINNKLPAYEKLLEDMLEMENKALVILKEWLQ